MSRLKTAQEIFNQYANDYQNKYMDVSLYHDSFDLFCNNITKEKADILEIACGPGNITRYLLNKRPGFKILGIDLALNMIELARINNPTAEFQLMDCRDIAILDKKYDGIMCGFCLPYLSKEESLKLIKDSAMLLKPNGVLYLSTMEDDYDKSGIQTNSGGDQVYMYFHQADYLSAALEENGFEIIELKRQDFPSQGGIETTDLLIVASKVSSNQAQAEFSF
ncbi:MAG: class I SAM-dependent methyltransferase [Phycisphaerae bacterium]|nr:class I SAM-dependent methyltransferase [Saprospiraceae bacterium]